MTIKEILGMTARLEVEAEKFLGATNEEFRLREKRTPEWFRASDKMVFWADVRNGLR